MFESKDHFLANSPNFCSHHTQLPTRSPHVAAGICYAMLGPTLLGTGIKGWFIEFIDGDLKMVKYWISPLNMWKIEIQVYTEYELLYQKSFFFQEEHLGISSTNM